MSVCIDCDCGCVWMVCGTGVVDTYTHVYDEQVDIVEEEMVEGKIVRKKKEKKVRGMHVMSHVFHAHARCACVCVCFAGVVWGW